MKRKIPVIIASGAFWLVALYFICFKTVMVVSYIRSEGCEKVVDSSGSVLVGAEGHVRDIASVGGVPTPPPPPEREGKELERIANEPKFIKSIACLNNSKCQIWERPGLTSSMVTMLVSGPSFDSIRFKQVSTGTQLDLAQSYFQERGVSGIAVAMDEAAPSCLRVAVHSVDYAHVLRWQWSH